MPPKGRSTKATVDVTLPDDLSTEPIVTNAPADGETGEKASSNAVSTLSDKIAVTTPAMTTAADAVPGSSGLTVEEKSQTNQVSVASVEEFLEDDLDEDLEIDIAKEEAFRLRFTANLLIPMVLSQEIKAIIAAVRLLMTKVWSSSLTENAGVTANIQEMTPGYTIKFISQHTENASYLKEKATNPFAVEVLFRHVPANIVSDVLKDPLVRFKMKLRKQTAFKEGFAFHRMAHPLTGADTDVIKGLVVQHPGDRNREEWICTQVCCGKAKGKTLMAVADHIVSTTHLLNPEKLGTATKVSLDKANLANLKKEYGA
ncbi:unnamed protein product [Closterium sp. NIES-65]|nr:unnamed protein product [Closterium sp. NIES-65]